jgi:hypothetical protein
VKSGTETQQSTSEFDANGNLLVLNNIGTTTTPLTNSPKQTKATLHNTMSQLPLLA